MTRIRRELPIRVSDEDRACDILPPRYTLGRRFFDRDSGMKVEVVRVEVARDHVAIEMVGVS